MLGAVSTLVKANTGHFKSPYDVALDSDGNCIVVSDVTDHCIKKVSVNHGACFSSLL